ncbi:MAG: class I SAM-dependent methyltransferase, partial [Erysipelotrichaceae bacterium]
MIELADVYDDLLQDLDAIDKYRKFIQRFINKGDFLELACGTGDLIKVLKLDYQIEGLDIDSNMLKKAMIKNPECRFYHQSMLNLDNTKQYDAIILFGDSINYLLEEKDLDYLFKQVKQHLNPSGIFMFDMHSEKRLIEFKEEYIEEGIIQSMPYQWSILSLDDSLIHHHFTFYLDNSKYDEKSVTQR